MRAIQIIEHGNPGRLELRNLPDPAPGPDEVVVRVRGCGLNRLDLWHEQGDLPIPLPTPRTPGGEVAGEVESVGSGVGGWKPGDRVAIQSNLFCGECEFCQQGEESICVNGRILGVQVDGGFAEKVLVPVLSLVRLPAEVDFIASAALTLAGSTAMHMLTSRTTVKPGDWVLVMGGNSGVGSAAIQIAKGLGARVISTGSTEEKRKFAAELGADHVVDHAAKYWARDVRQLTGRRGVDVVVEHIGGEVILQALQCLARNGTVVTCGATAGKQVPIDLWPLFVKQQRIVGSYGRNRAAMDRTLKWAAEGRLRAVVDRVMPLGQTREAFDLLRARKVAGKIVIAP
ncbi:MAG TPA: NADPH:quinone reductase [Verrucomicrobiales bacterium]|nr:NADPH:quinone reductase [Verrucomicrobiales bacterium]